MSHPCERCGKYEILLPICGPCQRDIAYNDGKVALTGNLKHGTTAGYRMGGCKCLLCITEHAAKAHVPQTLHGSGGTPAEPLEYTRIAYGDERADLLLAAK